MKQKVLLTLVSTLLASYASADPITLGMAKDIAASHIATGTEGRLVKAAGLSVAQTRKAALSNTTSKPYYIFSRGEGQGYVIVSGDDCLPEILGYTESGDFSEETCAPQLLDWLDGYEQLITKAQESGQNISRKSPARALAAAASTAKEDIPYLVQTHWHQSSPYNDQCPTITSNGNRALTGCVATAASQVVFYHKGELPDTLQYATPTYGYGDAPVTTSFAAGTPLKWDLMQLKYSGSEPAEYRSAVATFVAALGMQTWLTYGSSTSGQISNLVYTFSHQFNISSTCIYKSSYSQSAWEDLIYADLAAGRPIVYSGVHPTSGGHAVVLDGYQASTGLYHFNFGWGGQSDGWYTVDDQTGMNGFYGQQGMVYKVMPTRQNVEAEMTLPTTMATSRDNIIEVKVTNHSKAAFSGLMAFVNTTGDDPTSSSTASSTDNSLTLQSGETGTVNLTVKPTIEGTCYVFVTDKNRRVLVSESVESEVKTGAVTLNDISLETSSESVTGADGKTYPVIYNAKKISGALTIANDSEVDFSTSGRLSVEVSSDNGATFRTIGTKAVALKAPKGETTEVDFNLSSTTVLPFYADSLYRISLQAPITLSNGDMLTVAAADTAARFTPRAATLAATLEADSTLKFSGDWDATTFTTLVERKKNADAIRYDLIEVNHVGHVPAIDGKPNALIYVADDALTSGVNVVTTAGHAKFLSLQAGVDFEARDIFLADSVVLTTDFEAGEWHLLTSPAELNVPVGTIARSIDGHNFSGISGNTTNVSRLEAGKSYLVMTSATGGLTLTGSDAAVVDVAEPNADASLIGTLKATTTTARGFVLNPSTGYFEDAAAGTEIEAMGGYMIRKNFVVTSFTANSTLATDTVYARLGDVLAYCKEVLSQYKDMTREEATAVFADSIASAEVLYTSRALTTRTLIQAYVNALQNQCAAYKRSLVPGLTDINEDFTGLITNPSFENGTTVKGWTKTSTSVKAVSTSTLTNYASGCDGNYLLYCNTSTGTNTGISQTIKGLLPGTYTLTAMLGTKDDHTLTLYAGTKEASVTESAFGEYYLTRCTIENIEVGNDSTLEIGLKACPWYKADAFKLYCTATAADPTGIDNVKAGSSQQLAISLQGGKLMVTTAEPTPVTIHNLQGVAVWQQVVDGTVQPQLPKGLYIVGGRKVAVE